MALGGGQHTATGSAVALSSLVTEGQFRQIDVKANSDNAAVVYLGPSTVESDGTDAWIALEAGATWGARADGGDRLSMDLDSFYIVGTASDLAHIVVV